MKILRFAPYIVHPGFPEHAKNSTGFGRSVWDISRFSAKQSGYEEYLFTFNNRKLISVERVKLLSGGLSEYLKHCSANTFLYTLILFFKMVLLKDCDLKVKISIVAHSLSLGAISHHIKEIKPDIIHIHGLTYGTDVFLHAAIKSGIPFLITLHGLNLNVHPCEEFRAYEINKVQELNEKGIFISVISSGIKKQIRKKCKLKHPDKVVVINHGIDPEAFFLTKNREEIKKTMNLVDKRVIISVGSLSLRKNHSSLIRALALLPEEYLENIRVFIIGDGPLREQLTKEIQEYSLEKTIFLTGRQEGSDLASYFTIADLNVLLSHDEGFGRPILESFLFGTPSLIFGDFDAANDLYKRNCLFLINRRDDLMVANRIWEVLNTDIDPSEIRDHSKAFTWNKAANQYHNLYKKILDG